MTTIKLKLRMTSCDRNRGTLYYQVTCNRVTRFINSGYDITQAEWDNERAEIIVPDDRDRHRREYLDKLQHDLSMSMLRLRRIVKRLERSSRAYTVADICTEYRRKESGGGFIAFGRKQAASLSQMDKRQKSERYTYVLNSFCRFRDNKDLPIAELDSCVIVAYENYLKANNLCINSTSFYMRNLRAIYNEAISKGLAENTNPFKQVYTGIDKTVKRAVSLDVLRRIKQLDLTRHPMLDLARDLFMFSVYTRGMSFVDMAYLRKKDLHGDILTYHRRKTGQMLKIKWEVMMQDIVDKYAAETGPYLLPIIKNADGDKRRQYKSALRLTNKKLKDIGCMLGLMRPLTTYVARHAWASIAKEKHVPLSVISEAMGHSSEKTTRIYLASLDASEIDKANLDIMHALE